NSDAFDTYLELFNAAGESVDQDDDGGEGGVPIEDGEGGSTNARLISTIKDAGTYTLQVRAIGDTQAGAYTLKLAEAAPAPAATALPFGETVQGEITADGARDDEGRGYRAYTFSGTAGNRVQVVMRSGDFDTFIQVGRPGDAFEALGSDDDGLGEGTDSRLNYILPETGEYEIRVSPLSGDEKGLFSLELTDKGPQPEPGSILVGATARGTLDESDGIADDGAFFDAYAITVAEGDKLNVTLVSNDFDSYLDLGKMTDGAWVSTVSDDDSLSDTHAKVEWTVEDAGTYMIRARSFTQGETGAYTLAVERQP
ncbi:MAG TPA: PPC domain-containing protein, partial [Brevundimonas sp.]